MYNVGDRVYVWDMMSEYYGRYGIVTGLRQDGIVVRLESKGSLPEEEVIISSRKLQKTQSGI